MVLYIYMTECIKNLSFHFYSPSDVYHNILSSCFGRISSASEKMSTTTETISTTSEEMFSSSEEFSEKLISMVKISEDKEACQKNLESLVEKLKKIVEDNNMTA